MKVLRCLGFLKAVRLAVSKCSDSDESGKAGEFGKPDNRQAAKRSWPWIDADGGFTSVGVVVALTLAVTLIFTSSQIYWVNARSGDIQFAADAGALAAENVVAEYYVIARTADAIVLSLSLFGIAVEGVGIIVSCIPYCQG
ncbi:MAG: hypothetical protein LBH87_02440, partial [Coriobacteriales bacterium]|nr:hypothetical protein [Coriobacteriales bacterium]